jgi:hypothetical protein
VAVEQAVMAEEAELAELFLIAVFQSSLEQDILLQ